MESPVGVGGIQQDCCSTSGQRCCRMSFGYGVLLQVEWAYAHMVIIKPIFNILSLSARERAKIRRGEEEL